MSWLLRLDGGRTVHRLDAVPVAGESVLDRAEVSAPLADHEDFDWATRKVVPMAPAAYEAKLIARIDATRLGMLRMDEAKSPLHARKAAEALSTTGPMTYITAEAKARGITPLQMRQLVLAKMAEPDEAWNAQVEAAAGAAKAAIRAAPTTEGKRAAYAALAWPTAPTP